MKRWQCFIKRSCFFGPPCIISAYSIILFVVHLVVVERAEKDIDNKVKNEYRL